MRRKKLKFVFHCFFKLTNQVRSARVFFILCLFLLTSCDFNVLGGSNSKISEGYNPGLQLQSEPPTISPFTDLDMDENDTIQLPFEIADNDTVLFCNGINVTAASSDNSTIAPADLVISGTYPNCVLSITSHTVKKPTTVRITVKVFDFWTYVGSSFNLTVRRVEKPGPFRITDVVPRTNIATVNWTTSDYMDGSSARYFLYYRTITNNSLPANTATDSIYNPSYTPTPAASQSLFTVIRGVRSPYRLRNLTPDTTYEIYVTAQNSFNIKNPTVPPTETNHMFFKTDTTYKLVSREFVPASYQKQLANVPSAACVANNVTPGNVTVGCTELVASQALGSMSSTTGTLVVSGPQVITPTKRYSGRYRTLLSTQSLLIHGGSR